MNGIPKFPPFTSTEYIVELHDDGIKIHELSFDTMSNVVGYVGDVNTIENPFFEMNNADYEKWFKQYRYQKKALPIIRFTDSEFIYAFKMKWIKIRNQITKRLSNYKKFNVFKKTILYKMYD